MTPKEKSIELVNKYLQIYDGRVIEAKKCALIAVDEIIQLRKGYFDCINPMQDEKYWQEVKKEIEKL
jgi:hypothetical protein